MKRHLLITIDSNRVTFPEDVDGPLVEPDVAAKGCVVCDVDDELPPKPEATVSVRVRATYRAAGRTFLTERSAYKHLASRLWWWKHGDAWDKAKRAYRLARPAAGAVDWLSPGDDCAEREALRALNAKRRRTVERLWKWLRWRDRRRAANRK